MSEFTMPAKPEDLLGDNCDSDIFVAREMDVAALPAEEAAQLVESAPSMNDTDVTSIPVLLTATSNNIGNPTWRNMKRLAIWLQPCVPHIPGTTPHITLAFASQD